MKRMQVVASLVGIACCGGAFAEPTAQKGVVQEQPQVEEHIALAKTIGIIASFAVLKSIEQVSPDACAYTLKYLSDFNPRLEPIVPAVMPFLKSKHAKTRWAAVTFAVASKNQELVLGPILENLEKEDCMYVVDASLQVFFRFEKKTDRLVDGAKSLLGRPLCLPMAVHPRSCMDADGEFYYWPPDFPISINLQARMARAIGYAGPKVLPTLRENLQDANGKVVTKIACAVAIQTIILRGDELGITKADVKGIAESFLPVLVSQLNAEDEDLQVTLIFSIEHAAVAARKTAPELSKLADDVNRSNRVRTFARSATKSIETRLMKK